MAKKYVKIGGELKNIVGDGTIASASKIKDYNKDKFLSEINVELIEAVKSVDERIAKEGVKHYLKEETYNKSELNNMITTPNQKYITVTASEQTTNVTDVLPATGEADTVYRIGNWDGSHFDTSVYSEYAWKGNGYVHLSIKNISQSNIRMSDSVPGLLESVLSTEQPTVRLDNNTGCVEMIYNFN